MLRNLSVDLRKYPEIRRALATGEVVLVRDATTDPLYDEVRPRLERRRTQPVQTRSAIALRFSLRGAAGRRVLPPDHHRGRAAQRAGRPVRRPGDHRRGGGAGEGVRPRERGDGPGADAAPGGDRSAHQLLQPPRADAEARAGDGPRRPLRHHAHRHDDRHRQLQADQRHPRPPGGRPGAQAARPTCSSGSSGRWTSWPATAARSSWSCCPRPRRAESRNFAERILRRVATHDFGEPGKPVRVTISVGIASLPRRARQRRRIAAPAGRQPPLPRQERRPEPVPRLSTRRCPRCQTTYPAPARFCVKDGSPLVDVEPTASFEPTEAAGPRPRERRRGPRRAAPRRFRSRRKRWTACATLSGKLLDRRYQVGRRLGEGGMSYVYRAQDTETGAAVAVKILLPRLSRDPAAVERLRREADDRHAARPSERLPHPADGRGGPDDLPGHAVSRGRAAERARDPARAHFRRRGDPAAGPDVPGPAARARAPDHPSRSQARERDAGARRHHRGRRAALPGRGHGFRPGQGAAGRSRGRQADRHRHRARHARSS